MPRQFLVYSLFLQITLCFGSYRSCLDILHHNSASPDGIYEISPSDSNCTFDIWCDMTTSGGGWSVLQRRVDGSVDFYRNWYDYVVGFGELDGEFWIGNDNIATLSRHLPDMTLRFDLIDEGIRGYAEYTNVFIGDGGSNYRITCAGYSGSAGDSFSEHCGSQFSTKDRDNDVYDSNCAVSYTGAWWYTSCHGSNLNGAYGQAGNLGPRWSTLSGSDPVEFSEIKLREGFVYEKLTTADMSTPVEGNSVAADETVSTLIVDELSQIVVAQTYILSPKIDQVEARIISLENKIDLLSSFLPTTEPIPSAQCLTDTTLSPSFFTSLDGPCMEEVVSCLDTESCGDVLTSHPECVIPRDVLSGPNFCWENAADQLEIETDDTVVSEDFLRWSAFTDCVQLVCSCENVPGKWEYTNFLSVFQMPDIQSCCMACRDTENCGKWQFGGSLCVLLDPDDNEHLAPSSSDEWTRGTMNG